jgi:hypothetical protein
MNVCFRIFYGKSAVMRRMTMMSEKKKNLNSCFFGVIHVMTTLKKDDENQIRYKNINCINAPPENKTKHKKFFFIFISKKRKKSGNKTEEE